MYFLYFAMKTVPYHTKPNHAPSFEQKYRKETHSYLDYRQFPSSFLGKFLTGYTARTQKHTHIILYYIILYTHIHIRTHMHTYTHTYIHTYIHTHMHTHTYIRTHMHTYTHTYIYRVFHDFRA